MVDSVRLYRTRIFHRRLHPVEHDFTYRGYWWLVDVDQLDALPPSVRLVARFEPRDYCGDPTAPIGANVRAFLSRQGVDPTGLTIKMLTTPRQFGYSFNPITVFYCQRVDGEPVAVIAEVHNTYGQRHRYLLRPDEHHHAETRKELFVSPFYDTSGEYHIQSPVPSQSLVLTVSLHRSGEPPFVASVLGDQVAITPRTIAAALAVGTSLLTSARIRRQGISLWRKKIDIQPYQNAKGIHSD
ncbi:DUF1365 domain-containing protein [Smaragdicoccus niigatensis]|uniref:DUF1365 domain-containing protein n=1 Tax=Smaragdicoccus niigatensis TaxID=359359 RepID=UPI00037B540F|nr:DUF1365 domain-containing protein [Smaragdicoccus niigatensis]